ncbi:MAG: hypothetical protein L0Z50_40600 [Verrucomicrobiales bacterium]|nr:hypothetical protein [Verrucomicrobiales bacterium]
MQRLVNAGFAVLLLPFCIGSFRALLRVIGETGQADSVWVPLAAGATCWCVVYLLLPKPMWAYVFGHELTHAVWAWAFGGRVTKFKATSANGHVTLTRSNFLIVLAPYFFPIYAVLVLLTYGVLQLFFDIRPHVVWFHLLIGGAYAFHFTLTWRVLQTHQSDIARSGYLFSAAVIWFGNIIVLLIAIPLLTGRASVFTALGLCWIETGKVIRQISHWI